MKSFYFPSMLLAAALALFFNALDAMAINIGDQAPDFTLKSASGEDVSLQSFKGKYIVLEWYNGECPFVVNHYKNKDMQKLQQEIREKDVVWLTINSTNESHKDFKTLEQLQNEIKEQGINSTAVLSDPDGSVGKSYAAKTTPHMFIVDPAMKIVYQGAIDNQPSFDADPSEASNYVKTALEQAMAGVQITTPVTKPYGCSVKY